MDGYDILNSTVLERVKKGAAWLAENAPYDWERRLRGEYNGTTTLRWRLLLDTAGPLQFAFENMTNAISRDHGSVTLASIVRALKLDEQFLVDHGFSAPFCLQGEDFHSYVALLCEHWFQVLVNYYPPRLGPKQHSRLSDRRTPAAAPRDIEAGGAFAHLQRWFRQYFA